MALAESFAAFLDTGPSGPAEAGRWRRPGLGWVEVRGIYNAPHADAAAGDFAGVSTSAPVFATAEAELPAGAAQGDDVEIRGVAWRAADLQPDGTGWVRVKLEAF
ncbi:MAG: hypothetical protein AAF192_18115 [Pseudomonadota bacterium]